MLKTAAKYTFLATFIHKAKVKIITLLILIVLYILIEHSYDDVRAYLSKYHPEYLVYALWAKIILATLIAFGILFSLVSLVSSWFKVIPTPIGSQQKMREMDGPKLSKKDSEIIQSVSSKHSLDVEGLSEPDNGPQVYKSSEGIIGAIRSKKKLETRADKILKEIDGKGEI